eukprot:s123_g29.t1
MRRGSQDTLSPRLPEPSVDSADYQPEVDVERLAQHFAQRYGSLAEARKALDPEVELKLFEFELALKKWGVKVDNVVHFFAHIDEDYSGSISVEELLNVLDSPLDEIKRREKLRQRNEVKRIFEEMARSICEKFGSIEEAFQKHGSWLHSTSSSLSLAQFGRLAKQLDIELEAAVMQRVFNEIDEDKEGSISVEELQKALSYPIVRYVVVEIAGLLEQKHGGVVEAFESIGEIRPGSVSKVPPPPPSGDRPPVRLAVHEGASQEHFLKVLRQLKVLDTITDSAATMIWTSLQPFTMQDFVQRLLEEHRQAEEEKQRHEEDRERREKERKRRLAESLCLDSRQRAAKEVNSWLDEVRYLEAKGRASGGCKFDIRAYCLLLQDPVSWSFKAFYYRDAYLRTTSAQYTTKNLDRMVHLNNDAVQKNGDNYGKFESANKMSLDEFQKYLDEHHVRSVNVREDLMTQIQGLMADAVQATVSKMNPRQIPNCFEVFGFDFMVDADFRVWLIECNANPCLDLCSAYLSHLIPTMLDSALQLTVDQMFGDLTVANGKEAAPNKWDLLFDTAEAPEALRSTWVEELDPCAEDGFTRMASLGRQLLGKNRPRAKKGSKAASRQKDAEKDSGEDVAAFPQQLITENLRWLCDLPPFRKRLVHQESTIRGGVSLPSDVQMIPRQTAGLDIESCSGPKEVGIVRLLLEVRADKNAAQKGGH